MRIVLPLAILAVAAAVLMLTPAEAKIAGLDHRTIAAASGLVAMLAYYLASARLAHLPRMVGSIAVWALLFALVAGLYAYRYDASDFIDRMTQELMPSEPVTGQGGEAIVGRRLGGAFAVTTHINGARATLLFDTGASMVVLTAADARRAGINTAELVYDVPVTTANGAAMAAETRLDQISVGPIVMRKVSALVARPGALEESLLGMSFLERLKSYSVERGKLVMTAK
ncbi:aspartyl protease family protein [Roseiarcus fermentans]|uniref:Aspartyl protease family protein n=1 Tax=Roseiarcus fermentans TaxID=1473586 RepID=A0A366FGR1_9HYPH|nr:TIGR02281 family clan AA aspartic protease [Roseiarcus fermentans]RBP13872.1 aspartyl protease family protein [Roseiarcus fermentans]